MDASSGLVDLGKVGCHRGDRARHRKRGAHGCALGIRVQLEGQTRGGEGGFVLVLLSRGAGHGVFGDDPRIFLIRDAIHPTTARAIYTPSLLRSTQLTGCFFT